MICWLITDKCLSFEVTFFCILVTVLFCRDFSSASESNTIYNVEVMFTRINIFHAYSYTKAVLFICCPDCLSCPASAVRMYQATWAI